MVLLGDIIFFNKKQKDFVGMYVGNGDIIYVENSFVKWIKFSKVKVNQVRRPSLSLESYSYLHDNVLAEWNKRRWFRWIFPIKVKFDNVSFIAFLLDKVHILVKLDFKKVTFQDLLYSVRLTIVKE